MPSAYRIPFLLLFVVLAGVYFIYDDSDTKYRAAEESRAEANGELTTARAQGAALQRRLDTLRTGDAVIDTFLGSWQIHLGLDVNPGQIGQTLSDLAVSGGLLGTRRPTPLRQDYPLGGAAVPVQIVTFSVNGDFPAVFRWLGQVERNFPLARVESVSLQSRTGAEVELMLALAFPLHVMSTTQP
jgi:hypothetical protein